MNSSASPPNVPMYDHVVVTGVGLIGGSIAKALKARGLARKVTGLGRNRSRLLSAQKAGLIDEVAESPSELGRFDFAVVCTPVDRISQDVRALQAVAASPALITDAGSVKSRICRELYSPAFGGATFIGSHPMAGSEQGGWEHADAQLFEGRTCAVTPRGHDEETIRALESFWTFLGMRTVRLEPDQHDQIVALTSHMPHAAASAIASLLTSEAWPLAATGFRDTTRVAGGDPGLWTAILIENREAVSERIKQLVGVLERLATSLDAHDVRLVQEILTQGQSARQLWIQSTTHERGK